MSRLASLWIVPMMSIVSLPSCAPVPSASAPVAVVRSSPLSAEARRAEIMRQLRVICPQPLSTAALTRAADYLDHHPDAFAVIRDLDTLDRQSRACRGDIR